MNLIMCANKAHPPSPSLKLPALEGQKLFSG